MSNGGEHRHDAYEHCISAGPTPGTHMVWMGGEADMPDGWKIDRALGPLWPLIQRWWVTPKHWLQQAWLWLRWPALVAAWWWGMNSEWAT